MTVNLDLPIAPPIIESKHTKGSVLVVDNEPSFCVVMGIIFKLHGYSVHRAHNVSQAMSYLETHRPDLILAGARMPGNDGLTIIRNLRSEPRWSDIPAVVLSARSGEEARSEAFQAGADAFLAKPITGIEIKEVIEPLINGVIH